MLRLLIGLAWYVAYGFILFIIIEWMLPRTIMPYLPPFVASFFDKPAGIWPLMQTSKSSGIAQSPYWLILGDSYAKGMGDGQIDQLLTIHASGSTAAHSLQAYFKKDVVSFAEPGSGSWRGFVTNYVGGINYLTHIGVSWPKSPELMVYFFYEGNDLVENHLYAKNVFGDFADSDDVEMLSNLALQRSALLNSIGADTGRVWLLPQLVTNAYARLVAEEVSIDRAHIESDTYVPMKRWLPRMQGVSLNRARIDNQPVQLPGNMQGGGGLELSEDELNLALKHFDLALKANRARWADTPLVIVYIPAVLNCYDLIGDEVEVQNLLADDTLKTTIGDLQKRHQLVKSAIKASAVNQHVPFLDATSVLSAACKHQRLHGPKDWNHLNKQGYLILGNWLAEQIPTVFSPNLLNSRKNN